MLLFLSSEQPFSSRLTDHSTTRPSLPAVKNDPQSCDDDDDEHDDDDDEDDGDG
eukprot:CAMPEP_0167793212 /NCGR_PEP_ID=MMETSP0111_2-20121227/13035_1 /TAXON_ID=91324 /ORGANISM="Lotharella globosa, Strain CCCM811" /LENGTH=53 /DNA_ID=CAMNT_0007686305 /DNA_START=39 /DNA_END=196 /DNA_ORIENTATION=+